MFQAGNQYGKKSKRGKSIDKEMKEKIRVLGDGLIESIDIKELTTNQKIALLKGVMPYIIPKSSITEEDIEADTFSTPTVIVYRDTEEYKAYKELNN